jgi:3',5'-cyclic AMP phosphodiesterase CpdA
VSVVRLAHVSDIHVTSKNLGWRKRDFFSKRVAGWFNMRVLGRRQRFRHADTVLKALIADLRTRRPDRVVFSGDATNLGFENEFAQARALFGLDEPDPLPGLAVPGNHDYYTRAVAAAGLFEKHFDPWQQGERVDGARYPFAQQVGPVWLIGVNSSTAHRLPWDASGRVGDDQLERLGRLLARLSPGPRILVTHYPVCRSCGSHEYPLRGLRDLKALIRTATLGGVNLWLHGHRHRAYHHQRPPQAPFPVICAGSATQSGRWCYGEYTITGRHFHATRRVWSDQDQAFKDGDTFELNLT